ncbi:hypothetical protein J2D73_19905 [Acetobacter sacchari]|uniref:Knr4/Smi1-like domain-containing protein n=1 Tax=Acetobacter sacchari TaxID=2661687 RepID=A0ABS3M1J0_9PROT|nr:hypothetical protein [Acetobacter sacchari]MBO1362049.1 hypothetical protein [Acetobacter sacchari]
MNTFIDDLSSGKPYDQGKITGYSDDEISKIERLYDIKVNGFFRSFLKFSGRCCGGLLGDDPIILYRNSWTVRAQLLFQIGLFDEMQENSHYEYLKYKPFCFSLEGEIQYYFIMTSHRDSESVFSFNENTGDITNRFIIMKDYIKKIIQNHTDVNNHAASGELIKI